MCRLVAYRGEPTPLAPLVYGGSHSLLRQSWAPRELLSGSVNADGWGVAWWAESRSRRLAGETPLWQEDELEGVLGVTRSSCALAALRNTTPGIPLGRPGVPPLVMDGRAFVLNGFVPDFRTRHMRQLRAELSDERYAQLGGSSDTETLFLLALYAQDQGRSAAEALRWVARTVVDRVAGAEAQLTMALADGDSVLLLRTSSVERTNSLYLCRTHPSRAGATVASEPLEDGGMWEDLPDHALITLTADGAEVEPLEPPPG